MNYDKFKTEHGTELKIKRCFDIIVSFFMIIMISPLMIYIAYKIKRDSRGPVIFTQDRVTMHGRLFKIYKFRTMYMGSDKNGSITVGEDERITKFGKKLRDYRLDELPQLFNILIGDMSFVGTRPDVPKYVERYSDEMMKTLWLPAGVTSEASIKFKDEAKLIEEYVKKGYNADDAYVDVVLPKKMKYNLKYIRKFSLIMDIVIIAMTVKEIFLTKHK